MRYEEKRKKEGKGGANLCWMKFSKHHCVE
jgi:hypothetical protein